MTPQVEAQMNLWQKIRWRAGFILTQMWGKDPSVIMFSLRSKERRGPEELAKFLAKHRRIGQDQERKVISYRGYLFEYGGSANLLPSVADLVSIWGNDDGYFKRNFIDSGAFFFEGPYTDQQVAIRKGEVVIDAGANIGLFTAFASKKTGPTGRVYAFEPVERTKRLLETNVKNNGLENAQVVPFALGGADSEIIFSVPDKLGDSSPYQQGNHRTEKARQIRLDSFLEENGIGRLDFIKADIEGMEREMLRGAENSIKRFKPKVSICTYHRPDDPQVLEEMLLGFVPQYKIRKSRTKLFAWI